MSSSADVHLMTPENEKAAALDAIDATLETLEKEQRNPDDWERVCLLRAFAAIFSGGYNLAVAEAQLALVPPNKRSPESELPTDPNFDRYDLPMLRLVFQTAQSEPVRRFPIFVIPSG